MGDEFAQVAPAVQIAREDNERALSFETEFTADQQLERLVRAQCRARGVQTLKIVVRLASLQRLLRIVSLLPRPHHAGHRAFVGDGQRGVTQRPGAPHQVFGAGGAALEAEVREAMQLGIVRSIAPLAGSR